MSKENTLGCRRVALLVTDGFEASELHEPLKALKDAGAQAVVVTPGGESARAWKDGDWGDAIDADLALEQAKPEHFDGLVLPGGVLNPDSLRIDENAIAFIQGIAALDRPIAAICHGPWTLIDAGLVRGRTLTSWPSLRKDLENAGATWVDREVVEDERLITSRNPDDLPAFCEKLLAAVDAAGLVNA